MDRPRVFGEGAVQADAHTLRIEQERIAEWMRDYAGPGYGPHGSHKLLDDAVYEEQTVLRSPASGLREMRLEHAAVEPYRDLVDEVSAAVGDGATTALLLTAELVLRMHKAHDDGASWQGLLDGLELARRQARVQLDGLRRDTEAMDALAATAWPDWAQAILPGLLRQGEIDLAAIDVRTAPVDAPTWSEGVHIEPQETPRGPPVTGGVLLVRQGARLGLSHDWASHVIRRAEHMELAADTRDRQIAAAMEHVQDLGLVFVACSEGIDDRLGFRLVSRGVIVQDEVPDDLMERLATATGAVLVDSCEASAAGDVGRASVTCNPRRVGGWTVRGNGPGRTLLLPRSTATGDGAAKDEAERFLRAAGAVLAGPGALLGGGRWQRAVRDGLRRAADAAPGHAAFGVHVAADAFDALRAHLVRNHGQDPLDVEVLDEVLDPFACVRHSVSAAFEAVAQMLRLDGRFEKKQSDPTMLRGLQQATHTARQNNDVPAYM